MNPHLTIELVHISYKITPPVLVRRGNRQVEARLAKVFWPGAYGDSHVVLEGVGFHMDGKPHRGYRSASITWWYDELKGAPQIVRDIARMAGEAVK